ncbi:hypothetical protein Bca52824_052925 [Brassica carinata]|uniref:BZIP domain-containing protein n=1 Tax=Brassica carinata TaxID=52824 RepID=A0A8X7R497_BRACI|nr:hypothetical protein Bca52824_052925 [Brassica carinata]
MDRLLSSCGGDARRLSFLTLSETASCEFVFNPIKLIPMLSSSMCRLDLRVGPSDDHRYSSSPAAIAAESSQHHLNLLVFASSVATTTVVTAININTASVDLSSVYTAARAPINSFITAGLRVPKIIISRALLLSDNMMANRVEASTNIWRRRAHSRHLISLYRSTGARPSWGNDSERDDELNSYVVVAQSSVGVSSVDLFPEQALKRNQMLFQQGKPPKNLFESGKMVVKSKAESKNSLMLSNRESARRSRRRKQEQMNESESAEHSTLLGRLGDMNQKYDAAAVDNRILRADIETREQKYILLRLISMAEETVKRVTGVNPLQWARPNMGMLVNNTSRIPSTTGTGLSPNQRVEVNREGLQNQFTTNPKNMYETIGITSINHKIESSTLWFLKLLSCSSFFIYCANP